jgi:hypothetical protein
VARHGGAGTVKEKREDGIEPLRMEILGPYMQTRILATFVPIAQAEFGQFCTEQPRNADHVA